MEYRALSKRELGRFLLAIGLGAYALAIAQYINASVPDSSGRWGWFVSSMYSQFGNAGLVAFWFLLGTFLILVGWHRGTKD